MYNSKIKIIHRIFSICILTFSFLFVFCFLGSSAIGQTNTGGTFSNTTPIPVADAIFLGNSDSAYSYPSTISVNGLSGTITDIDVRINGLTYNTPHDLALLLVAPDGRRMILQNNAGGNAGTVNVTYRLDDQAANGLPTNVSLTNGGYKPTSRSDNVFFPLVGTNPPPADCQPAGECPHPAPAGSATLNGTFGGGSPNGAWKLYVVGRLFEGVSGSITGGWSLIVTTSTPESPRVLRIDEGNGNQAEFSDYSLTNVRVTDGVHSGRFCFTLKNTTPGPIETPTHISSINFYVDNNIVYEPDISDYSISGNFNGGIHPQNNNSHSNGDRYTIFNAPYYEEGISPNGTASFCVTLRSNNPFTLDDLIGSFAVSFSYSLPGDDTIISPIPGSNTRPLNWARLYISSLSADEMCFSVSKCRPETEKITGVGFDLPGDRGPFSLISSQYTNNASFTTLPSRLRYFTNDRSGRMDFGFLTGRMFTKGLPQFERRVTANKHCVRGNFSGLTPKVIMRSVVISFESEQVVAAILNRSNINASSCNTPPLGGGGVGRSVRANPR